MGDIYPIIKDSLNVFQKEAPLFLILLTIEKIDILLLLFYFYFLSEWKLNADIYSENRRRCSRCA